MFWLLAKWIGAALLALGAATLVVYLCAFTLDMIGIPMAPRKYFESDPVLDHRRKV